MYEYEPMKETLNPNQVRNSLMHWYDYEHELSTSSGDRFLQIKSFFYRLSYLTKDERDFLAYIYYHEKPKNRPNQMMIAEKFNLGSSQKVTQAKNKIIFKLQRPVSEPYKPGNDYQGNLMDNTLDVPNWVLIEQLFNELQKMHP